MPPFAVLDFNDLNKYEQTLVLEYVRQVQSELNIAASDIVLNADAGDVQLSFNGPL